MMFGSVLKPLFAIALLAISLPSVAKDLQRPSELAVKLAQQCPTYDSDKTLALDQIIELAQRFRFPMGIEWVDAANDDSQPIHFENLTVKEILERILDRHPGYKFSVGDEIVQITHIDTSRDTRNFLNLRFPRYEVKNESLSQANYWLRVWIKRSLHPETSMGGGLGGVSAEPDFNKPTINFSMEDVTVRDILNRFLLAQGNCLWVVHLRPGVLMEGEAFFAQQVSPKTGKGNSDFTWEFIPLTTPAPGRAWNSGDASDNFKHRYGSPRARAYIVREGIAATVSFDDNNRQVVIDEDPKLIRGKRGVINIHSSSTAISSRGTPYNTW